MKYGMNLLLWTDIVRDGHLPLLEKLKGMGFDGVEVPVLELEPERFRELGRHLDNMGLERTGVTVRGADDDPMSADHAVRRTGVDANKRAVDCCQAAGIEVLAGPYHSALGVFSGAPPTDDERDRAGESMREVAEHAADAGVMLALEYLNRFECYLLNSAADMVTFVDGVDHPHCRMMYDTFHAHIEEKDSPAAIRACAAQTVHVHISENDRSTPGSGQVAWDDTFDALHDTDYDGWLVIEAFSLALEHLVPATKIWRRMFESEDQLARDGLAFMRRQVSRRW